MAIEGFVPFKKERSRVILGTILRTITYCGVLWGEPKRMVCRTIVQHVYILWVACVYFVQKILDGGHVLTMALCSGAIAMTYST